MELSDEAMKNFSRLREEGALKGVDNDSVTPSHVLSEDECLEMRELLDDPQLALPDHMSMLDLIRRHVLPVVVLGTPLLFLTGYPMEWQIGYIQI